MAENSILGIIVAILVGVVFAGVGGFMYYDQQQAVENAVEVEGEVIDSGVRERYDSEDNEYDYYPEVEYRYTYEGQEYTSDNVFPGFSSRSISESRAQEIASEHQPGDSVTVYVQTDEPSESFLIHETQSLLPLALSGMGGLVALGGVWSFVKRSLGMG